MGTARLVLAAAQCAFPALKLGERARAAPLREQSAVPHERVPERGLSVRSSVRVSGADGPPGIFFWRWRLRAAGAGPAHVGDELHSRSRRLRTAGMGSARR